MRFAFCAKNLCLVGLQQHPACTSREESERSAATAAPPRPAPPFREDKIRQGWNGLLLELS